MGEYLLKGSERVCCNKGEVKLGKTLVYSFNTESSYLADLKDILVSFSMQEYRKLIADCNVEELMVSVISPEVKFGTLYIPVKVENSKEISKLFIYSVDSNPESYNVILSSFGCVGKVNEKESTDILRHIRNLRNTVGDFMFTIDEYVLIYVLVVGFAVILWVMVIFVLISGVTLG